MVRGQPAQASATKQTKPANKKSNSKVSNNSTVDQCTPKNVSITKKPVGPVCLGCGTDISNETKALQCDSCGSECAWKCIDCLHVSSELYDMLMADDGPELKWLCQVCDRSVSSQDVNTSNMAKLDAIIHSVDKLMDKVCSIESRLLRMDQDIEECKNRKQFDDSELMDKLCAIENRLQHMDKDIEACKNGRKFDDMKVIDCVQKVISEKEQDSASEEAELERRKTNVIVYGLPESSAAEPNDREDDDMGQITMLLHELKCDNVEVMQVARLGSRQAAGADTATDDASPRTRPVKLVLKTAEQKHSLLKNAKNLRWKEEGGWNKVFIHADLTLKQRECRRKLVAELKMRKDNGESDLIIVNGKIVRKW